MRRKLALVLLLLSGVVTVSGSPARAWGQLVETKMVTLEAAKTIAVATDAEARKHGWRMVVAIVDPGGHLLYLQRSHDTQTGSVEVAIQKARSAVAARRPTKVWEEALAAGRTAVLALPGLIPIEGGLPLVVDGQVVGGIGVSGGTAAQDGQVAKAGADALAAAR